MADSRWSVDYEVHVLSPLGMLSGHIGIDPDAMAALREEVEVGQVVAGETSYQGSSISDLQDA